MNTIVNRVRDFNLVYSLVFFESKYDEYPRELFYSIKNVIKIMGVTLNERDILASYSYKDCLTPGVRNKRRIKVQM